MCSHSVFPLGWSDDVGIKESTGNWRKGLFGEIKSWAGCVAATAPGSQQVSFTCWQRWRWSILSGGTACPWYGAWTGSGAGRRRSHCSVCSHRTQTGTGSLCIQGTGNPPTWERYAQGRAAADCVYDGNVHDVCSVVEYLYKCFQNDVLLDVWLQ